MKFRRTFHVKFRRRIDGESTKMCPLRYIRSSLSRGHETVTMTMNYCCYCFDGLWKVKAKYIVLCSNALAKWQNATGTSHHPNLMDNCPTCNGMARPYQSTERLAVSPFQVKCTTWNSVAMRVVLLEKNIDMKYMEVNILRNIARVTKTCSDIRTD